MVPQLRLREALENNRLDCSGGIGDKVRDRLAFDLGERLEHVHRGVLLTGGTTDTDSNAQEIGADVGDGRTNPVLASVAATRLDPNGIERQVDVVMNHDDVVGFDVEELRQLPDGTARRIHETQQRRQNHLVGAGLKAPLGHHRDRLVALRLLAHLFDEAVDHAVTDGMAMRGVVRPGVTKPDYEPRIGHDYSAAPSAAGAASAAAGAASVPSDSALGTAWMATMIASPSSMSLTPAGRTTSFAEM